MPTLYHLTNKQHLQGIMREGLIPQLDRNCHVIDDKREAVFLCEEKDIGKWQIILGSTALLAVDDINQGTLEKFMYSSYSEYACSYCIPPENIRIVTYDPKYTVDDMHELCESYLMTISSFTVSCARCFNDPHQDAEYLDYIKYMAKGIIFALNHLDYSVAKMSEWEKFLKDYGSEGEYTFCDTYGNTNTRLWEQLPNYDSGEMHADLMKIHDFVKDTFPFAKKLCTGGFEIPGSHVNTTSYF